MKLFNETTTFVEARYTEQRISRYRGNPLIEALPQSMDELALVDALFQKPEFSREQRSWPTQERLKLVSGLSSFMVPLGRHIQLATTIDVLMREGYVGRAPRTAEHTKLFQKIYENQKAGKAFSGTAGAITAQLSTSLIGISGMGKTTTVKRALGTIPQVIYHPDLKIWQIPYLHIETPHDGVSVKGLAHSILRKVDALIPDANYYETYALRGKPSVETLMNHVARVLHIHCVGLLVCDEIQNLENAPKNKQSLMTLLVSASNELQVPIMFIGTNKARRVLGLDFRQARRSIGQGLAYWDRLTQGTQEEPDEWDDFLGMLWNFQWTQKPVALNHHLSNVMYHYSQGVIDIAIKLFAAAQWRAMLDGSETLTAQLIESVAQREMSMVMPMVEALRTDNLRALEAYDDIAPLGFEDMLRDFETKYIGKRLRAASSRPGDNDFAPKLATLLSVVGVEDERAEQIATNIEKSGDAKDVLDGAALALKQLKPPARLKLVKQEQELPLEAGDLRNAIRRAKSEGTKVFEQLQRVGAVCDLNTVLPV